MKFDRFFKSPEDEEQSYSNHLKAADLFPDAIKEAMKRLEENPPITGWQPEPIPRELYEEAQKLGLISEEGAINWDCPLWKEVLSAPSLGNTDPDPLSEEG